MKVLQLKPLVGSLETERRETDTMYNMVAHQVERLVHYLLSALTNDGKCCISL